MNNYHLPIVLGLAATVMISAPLPVRAEAKVYREISGTESIKFDSEGLAALESLGLSLASVGSTTTPRPGYPYAWDLESPSLGTTNFTFLYDPETNFYAPLTGPENFLGTVTFDVDTSKLNLPSQIEFKDFIVDFDENFNFSVESEGISLFDVEAPSLPQFDLENQTWSLEGFELFISQEFSDFLIAAGASQTTVGLKFGETYAERGFVEVTATSVPEPVSSLAIFAVTGTVLAASKRRA
jgi:hypothetical protein